jgi:hypothetical protein
LLLDTSRIERSANSKSTILIGALAFTVALISHGVLDYIPHCYPVNSKLDAIIGLTMILTTTWLTNKKYRLIMGLSFLGSVLPDLIDLLPRILNKQFKLNIPVADKIFPWHLSQYSGSIYNGDCSISILNHILLFVTIGIVIWCRRTDAKIIFRRTL